MKKPLIIFADILHKDGGAANSLGILCVAASASRCFGVNVLIDSFQAGVTPQLIASRIADSSADLVGFSVNALNEFTVLEVIANLKQLGRKPLVVIGGPSASYSQRIACAADFVVHGEGEDPTYKLACAFADGGQDRVLKGEVFIPCLSTRESPIRAMQQCFSDLSESPSPLVPSSGSSQFLPVNGTAHLYWETTRGCSFKCAFCCYSLLSSRFRPIPNKRLLAELEFIRDNCTEHLFITDAVLGGQKKRTKEILRWLANLDVSKSVRLRGEYIDNELADLLFEAQISYLDLGLQTTNPKLSWIRKNDLNAVQRSLSYLHSSNVKANLDLIIGFPGDTIETMLESIRFVIEDARPDSLKIFPLKVYPGTKIEGMARSKESSWLAYDPITCETRSGSTFGPEEFANLVCFSNATSKLYHFLSSEKVIDVGQTRSLRTFDRFYHFLKRRETKDVNAFLVLNMPQNSHATDSVCRLWRQFVVDDMVNTNNQRGESGTSTHIQF